MKLSSIISILALSAALFGTVAMAADAPVPTTWPKSKDDVTAFVKAMPTDAWIKILSSTISLKYFIGKPVVAIFNPYDEDLVNVMCDGKWSLVGPNAYNKKLGAPESIPAHHVGFIPTDGFDGYCKSAIVGLTENGERHNGELNIPGDFSNSTAIFFR